MTSEEVKKLFRQYLSRNISDGQKEAVEYWYHSFESEEPLMLSDEKEKQIKEEIWNRIVPALSEPLPNHRNIESFWVNIAAMLIVICSIVFLVSKRHFPHSSRPDLFTEVHTKSGERKKLILSDGSVIMLNVGTKIRISNDFSRLRTVKILDGEVYFDVRKDPSRPFLILNGKITTKVLGTAFNISAYQDLSKMSIAVHSGTVQVSSSKTASILRKEEMFTYDRKSKTSKVEKVGAKILSWQHGVLLLDDVSFEDMVILMEKNFTVKIEANQRFLTKTRYTATLPTSMSPIKAVEVIAAIHNLKIKQLNGTFLLFR
ncbi:FecR family protein [Arcticibacter tournemirensis]|uniref:FecR family protein n=1 Tax=Arcticibacter tournemirensis TaxID=699437 RepID=A0A4Q0MAD8_9SPHI|nr:FecR domain-containing protein [Arcticibacter tournemirensis]RXF70220.1 FecR family protein [Arcticibacter tournemirensis]